ncbi:MAG: hypothetical protein IJZ23_05400 [Roseburia sp.]|nr:hypothetical protein [Roseburia sp.]
MKNKYSQILKKLVAISLLFVLCLADITYVNADNEEEVTGEEVVDPENLIEISTAEDLLALAKNCKLDAYSIGKRVELKNNINLSGVEFSGIPYFNGVFDGNGHEIINVKIAEKGSQYGFFRYIGELGVVSDLRVSGIITPEGSQEEIGGIAGVNYGTIQDCSFGGRVAGVDTVGAIAGLNCSTGKIIGCETDASILATDNTGGIVGVNEGIVTTCTSKSSINVEELETEMDLGGIDIGTMNFTQTVVTRNNMGGIAGNSTGIIKDCQNFGTIGYSHTGYNVGGIVGKQSGVVMNCVNEGTVYGRKDVGGIVGQAEPYVESEYLSDQLEQTEKDINRINRTLDSMSSNLEKNAEETKNYSDALAVQFESTTGSLSNRLDQMGDANTSDNPEAQQCMDNINAAMDKIESIQTKEGELTQADIEEIQRQMQIIEENTARLQEITENENATNKGNSSSSQNNVQGLFDSIQKSSDILTNGINSVTSQTEDLLNRLEDSTAVIRGEEDYITDISSIKTASEMDGVISNCVNKGTIEADLNVGGIAGTMNLEYGDDPEENLDTSQDMDIATRSEVNDVIIDSKNYGTINGKKSFVGSIVGYQEFGYLYQCEGYGHVNADAGSYIGGIAGMSGGTIEKSYAMLDINAQDNVGGIVGEGASVIDCLSIVKIEAEGERIGSVAGFLEENGSVKGNYFVKDGFDAIDDISYLGIAEPMSYEEMVAIEGIPEGFSQVQVAFKIEDTLLSETMVAYGTSLSEKDFPEIEEREGYYVVWPEESVYTNICNNVTVEAEYVPWTQSIAVATEDTEKTLFIAVGEFYEGTKLQLSSVEAGFPNVEGMKLLYNYDWTICSEREKTLDSVEGHFYMPEDTEGEVQVYIVEDEGWTPVATTVDGSYVVAEIPYEAAFAVVEIEPDMTSVYVTIGAGVVALILVISFIIVHNKRKKKAK